MHLTNINNHTTMKKTIIALLALTGVVGANTLELSSKLSYTDPTGVNSFEISAYDTFVDQTRSTIDGYTMNGIDCIDADRDSAIPAPVTTKTVTLNLANMYTEGDSSLLSAGMSLTQICFIGRDDAKNRPAGVTLSLTIGDTTYTSDAVVYGASDKHGAITFNFTNGPVITTLSDISVTYSGTESMGAGVFKDQNGAVLTGTNGTVDATANWVPIAKVTLTSVPEPATATLSLLALAGLAARRRRH